ncbi:hypothetical protein ACFV3R_02345 [Streptomyces sp. NPDC059740]|uniref:hypothetical protein n=1 Tax=Streptomyces sp. NPDC059740 TaxID=3346926 RepID=UPI00364B25E0
MSVSPEESREVARGIGARLAGELQAALAARGLHVPVRGGEPVGGRACVEVQPLPYETVLRLVDALGPPPLRCVRGDDSEQEAEDAVRSLRRALFAAGVVLPSLRVEGRTATGAVLVALGGAPPRTVHRLAAMVARGARAGRRG